MKTRMILMSIVTVTLGLLVGAGVGFLYAPRSGRATRARLRSRGVQVQEKVTEDINLAGAQIKDRVDNLTSDARDRVVEFGDKLKESVSSISLPFPANGR